MSFQTPDQDTPVVKKVTVTEPVPEQFAELGFLDSWRQMARRSAFDVMLKEIGPEEAFTAKFSIREVWQPASNGSKRQLSIVCDIEYQIENGKSP